MVQEDPPWFATEELRFEQLELMDRLQVEGGSVLEELPQPCDSFGRSTAFLVKYVKGEYEDEDGDWATGFIFADPKPISKPDVLNVPILSKAGKIGQVSVLTRPEIIYRRCSEKESEAKPNSTESCMGYKNGSEILCSFPVNEASRQAIDGYDPAHPLCLDSNDSDSDDEMDCGDSIRNSVDSVSSSVTNEEMAGMIGTNRKCHSDIASFSFVSDQSDEATFLCEACSNALPLDCLFPMLNCDCLLCIPCCRLHVESSLSLATRRSETDLHSRDELGDPTIDDTEDGIAWDEQGLDHVSDLFTKESVSSCLDSISCPTPSCSGRLQLSEAQVLAPTAFQIWEESASLDLMKQSTSYINCPGCDIVIEKVASELPPGIALSGVPEFDRTLPFIELDSEGRQLSRSAICHRAENRFRCSMCSVDFCGQCRTLPYHLGKTCEEFEEDKNAVKCIYCEDPIRSRRQDDMGVVPSVIELRRQLSRDDVDALWCIEKKELIAVQRFASSVCSSNECRKLLQMACTRNLECGHHCGGVRGERQCLPCLEDDCRHNAALQGGSRYLPSADDLCSICMVEPLRQSPSIQMRCGHVVHLGCARMKLEEGFPGPAISHGYLNCPQCPEHMHHPSLDRHMQKPLALLEQVKKKATTRLKMEGLYSTAKELKVGGRFEGKPADFALQMYQYYLCCKCKSPYFGGLRDCGADNGDQIENAHNPLNLICGGCSASAKGQGLCTKGHGKEFVEFKCKFCCSVATYFCFGHIHFCEMCHKTRPDCYSNFTPVRCRGPTTCPLRVSHLPNGQECCLGCSMCRLRGQ